jgi:hypothetical protein
MTFCLICLKEEPAPYKIIEYIGLTLCNEHYLKVKKGVEEFVPPKKKKPTHHKN